MPLLREDEAVISVAVKGVNLPRVYSWASLDGGDVEAQDTKTRPGGLLPEVNLGGPTTRSDVTVKRNYSPALHAYLVQLENVVGRANMSVSYAVTDANGSLQPGVYTLTGILKAVQRPKYDANATTPAFLGLVMGCDASASISQ